MAELIQATDSLNEGRKKLNAIAKEMNNKEVSSMPEIVIARDGESSLGIRLERDQRRLNDIVAGLDGSEEFYTPIGLEQYMTTQGQEWNI